MRITRILAGSAAAITAVAGMGLAAAGPASATLPPGGGTGGTWRAFGNTNPITSTPNDEWACASSRQIGVNVFAQVCALRSFDTADVQAAIIVRNDKPVTYDAQGSMDLVDTNVGGSVNSYVCPLSGVAPDTWSVCFGSTLSNPNPVFARGDAGNFVDLGTSPDV